MRLTSTCPEFPFGYPGRVCYFTVAVDPHQYRTRDELRAVVRRAVAGEVDLYAVWPGDYRSDLFKIDNPRVFADKIKA